MSTTVVATSVTSFIGFLLNCVVLLLVLSRGRRDYHYLFAAFLSICALWDLGIFLSMVRNNSVDELPIYGNTIWWPCTFMFAIIYHFTCAYLGEPRKKRTILLWVVCTIFFLLGIAGLSGRIVGVYHYSWGNIYRPDSQLLTGNLVGLPLAYFFGLSSLWYLFRAFRKEVSPTRRRYILYILVSFSIIHVAVLKVAILYGVDNGLLMPACMLFNDMAAALIGIAIVKYRLLDITVIIKKTTIYSALGALVLFVFGLSEHLFATYVGNVIGEASILTHLVSVAAVIGVVMPFRRKLERSVDRFFAERRFDF
jgi:hypothetical protein